MRISRTLVSCFALALCASPLACPCPAGSTGSSSGGSGAGGAPPSPACVKTGTLQLWAWGANGYGQVEPTAAQPDPQQTGVPWPVQVQLPPGLAPSNIVMLAAGTTHNLMLDDKGGVWAWGGNGCGQVGVPPTDVQAGAVGDCSLDMTQYVSTPTRVSLPKPAKSIAAGNSFSAALLSDGTVMTWGYNLAGQLGGGTLDYCPHWTPSPVQPQNGHPPDVQPCAYGSSTPLPWPKGETLTAVMSIFAGFDHMIAVDGLGRAWGWGGDYHGELGQPWVQGSNNYPTPPKILTGASTDGLTAGGLHTYWLQGGTVWGFGGFFNPGAGGDAFSSTMPQEVMGLSAIRRVAAGGYFALALDSSGKVWSWGDQGELGYDSGSGPARIDRLTTPIVDVWAGDHSGFALDMTGQLWAWGGTSYGELGAGPLPGGGTSTPVRVSGITNVSLFSTNDEHSLALAYACEPPPVAPPLTADVAKPLPKNVVTSDTESCLPSPPSTIEGSATGGVAPYVYAWTVTILNADGTTRAGPMEIGSDASASTGTIPASWWYSNLDLMTVQASGEPVRFTLTVTDADGTQATASETINWQCGPG